MAKNDFLWIHVLVMFFLKASEVDAARILVLSPIGSTSHRNFYMGISRALAEGGHQITFVSTVGSSKPARNIREVVLPESTNVLHLLYGIFDISKQYSLFPRLLFNAPDMCIRSLATEGAQELKKEKFDLIILSMFFDVCYISLSHHFQAPLIHTFSGGLYGHYSTMAGDTTFSSISKNEILSETDYPYSFWTRFKNLLLNLGMSAVNDIYTFPRSETLCREAGLCPPDMPPLREMSDNASLVLINSVKALEMPARASNPNIIYLGGIHCRPAKPLNQELEKWVSSAREGFIFFSLGTAIPSTELPEKHRLNLIKVFGSLKQRVLWKFDKDMKDLPPNVRLEKWLPQQDLLGHKKVKLFITHGGLLSIQEATYHAVPVIGMPVFGDQYTNAKEVKTDGWGDMMEWQDLEEETFRSLILNAIDNENFKKVVQHRSRMMRDVPQPPSDVARFWVDYVLRHNGAGHLKSPLFQLHTYELYCIDVLVVIAVIFLIAGFIVFKCTKFILGFILRGNSVGKEKKTK